MIYEISTVCRGLSEIVLFGTWKLGFADNLPNMSYRSIYVYMIIYMYDMYIICMNILQMYINVHI